MPRLPIHCDYHQGNLKYKESRVIGVFDFDWSKIDYRLFDLGLALVYFCAHWEGKSAGSLSLEKCKTFINAYEKGCKKANVPGPLTGSERSNLSTMVAAGNLFVLHWVVADFYAAKSPEPERYLSYLVHNINLMQWIESHKFEITAAAE